MKTQQMHLHTIPVSHYCEKARWALDRRHIEYTERPYVPVLHMGPCFLRFKQTSVPILQHGQVAIKDSHDILRYLDSLVSAEQKLIPSDPLLRVEVENWERLFNDTLGPAVRRWAYFHLLERKDLLFPLWSQGTTDLSKRLAWSAYPLIQKLVRQSYRIHSRGAEKSLGQINEVMGRVSGAMQGKNFLVGEKFTAADLTFASLACALVMPAEFHIPWAPVESLPDAVKVWVERWRLTTAGEFVLRMYRTQRR